MNKFSISVLTILLSSGAAMLVWMADQWMSVGYGLNPWISIPLAMVCLLIPLVLSERQDFLDRYVHQADLEWYRHEVENMKPHLDQLQAGLLSLEDENNSLRDQLHEWEETAQRVDTTSDKSSDEAKRLLGELLPGTFKDDPEVW